jgi:hypothetical protein
MVIAVHWPAPFDPVPILSRTRSSRKLAASPCQLSAGSMPQPRLGMANPFHDIYTWFFQIGDAQVVKAMSLFIEAGMSKVLGL